MEFDKPANKRTGGVRTNARVGATYSALVGFAATQPLPALLRPLAAFLPSEYVLLISISGLCWIAAFALFLVEYAPVLLFRRKPRPE